MVLVISASLIELNHIVELRFQHRDGISDVNACVANDERNGILVDLPIHDATN
jgi:hypothetical protein